MLCIALAGLIGASVYLNNTQGNVLSQLCHSTLEAVSDGRRPSPELSQLGAPRIPRRRRLCTHQGTRYERGLTIKTYSLGPYDLEYELEGWPFLRSEVERLRGAYIKGQIKHRTLRLKISADLTKGSLVPDGLEDSRK